MDSEHLKPIEVEEDRNSKSNRGSLLSTARTRLVILRQLHDLGEVSEADFQTRHAQIISQLTDTEFCEVAPSGSSQFFDNTSCSYIQEAVKLAEPAKPPDWSKFPFENAVKIGWNTETKDWEREHVKVKLDDQLHFAEGSMNKVFHIWDQSDPDHKYVAKLSKVERGPINRNRCLQGVKMLAIARQLGRKFNSLHPPKNVEFLSTCVMLLLDRGDTTCVVEQFISNYNFVSRTWWRDVERDTPIAFAHFSYEASGGELLVCDIQDAGDFYVDPLVLSVSDGNDDAVGGIGAFLSNHRCNKICQYLKLTNTPELSTTTGLSSHYTVDLRSNPSRFNVHIDGLEAPLLGYKNEDLDWIEKVRSGSTLRSYD